MRKLRAVFLATGTLSSAAAAQDAHYWTHRHGPAAQFTEGTLVGGVNDLSAVYYNPAALALLQETRFDLGLNSLELTSIDAADAAGEGLDFDTHIFHFVPGMLAGQLGERGATGGRDRNRFAFAFLSTHNTDWDFAYSRARISPGEANGSAGYGRTRQRLLEYWTGVAWSRRLAPGLAVGITPFGAYRGQRSRRTLALADTAAGSSVSSFVAREHEHDHVRALAKIGVAWRQRGFELGATVTTPGVRLYGRGKVRFDATVAGTNETGFLSASTQRGLAASFHSPGSIAAGATYRRPQRAFHTTVEWFSRVAPYAILSPEPAQVAGRSEALSLEMTGRAKSVVNLGVGLEQRLSGRARLYAGAARDASSWQPGAETLAVWDLSDLAAGVAFDRQGSQFALGVSYAWGSGELPQAIAPPDTIGLPLPSRRATFRRLTLSLGASFKAR